ncbi:MAG: tyrosine-type recombinase/integrase [Planctomycetota bacterium]|jgi:integrase
MGLRWAQVDLDSGHLTIQPSGEKTGRGRQVPLTDQVARTLRRLATGGGVHRHPTSLVFVRPDGKGWTHKTKDKRFREAVEALKDEEVPAHKRELLTFKGLRDSTVTALLEMGEPWPVVGRIVGHSSPSTTMRYMGAMMEGQKKAMARLGQQTKRRRLRKVAGG